MKISSLLFKDMITAMNNALKTGAIPRPDKEDIIKVDDKANLSFVAWGDPQISSISPLRSARVYSACEDIRNSKGHFDALVLLGDITEYGMICEYKTMAYLLRLIQDKFSNILAVSGNHDIRLRNYYRQLHRFNRFLDYVPKSRKSNDFHYYHSCEIKGYKFIMLGANKTCFESTSIGERQLEWLKSELDSADEDKPVFVFNHQALDFTNGLPYTWLGEGVNRGGVGKDSEKLQKVLSSRKNVVFISGHIHYGVSQYTYEDLGNIKAINAPTIGVLNHGDYSKLAQGIVISVYDDKILCRCRVFGEGRWVDEERDNSSFVIPLG